MSFKIYLYDWRDLYEFLDYIYIIDVIYVIYMNYVIIENFMRWCDLFYYLIRFENKINLELCGCFVNLESLV
jgi:hypothetical protein